MLTEVLRHCPQSFQANSGITPRLIKGRCISDPFLLNIRQSSQHFSLYSMRYRQYPKVNWTECVIHISSGRLNRFKESSCKLYVLHYWVHSLQSWCKWINVLGRSQSRSSKKLQLAFAFMSRSFSSSSAIFELYSSPLCSFPYYKLWPVWTQS